LFLTLVGLPVFSAVQLLLVSRRLHIEQNLDNPVIERGGPVRLQVRLEQGRMVLAR